jgi:predicted nucleic acid-binding protein
VIVVCDASPIIALSAVGQLSLLQKLYGQILIPDAVAQEVTSGSAGQARAGELRTSDWITVKAVQDSVLLRSLHGELDRGEAEAIALAVEAQAELLLVDERLARRVALRLGLSMVGVLGVLLEAKSKGCLPAVRPVLDDLLTKAGFRVGVDLYALVLSTAGEAPDPGAASL